MNTYKLLLIGDRGVGKTTFVNRHVNGGFEQTYVPSTGVEIHPLKFYTNNEPICFDVWDITGQGGVHYTGAHGAIVMFSLTSRISFNNVIEWIRRVRNVCKDIPIILVGTKVDT